MNYGLAVCYHYVNPYVNKFPKIHGVTPDKLKQDIDKLSLLGNFTDLNHLFNKKNKILRGFDNSISVILTFDDGLKDHYEFVMPIVLEKKIKATFYIPTGIFEGRVLDVHKIQFILAYTKNKRTLTNQIYEFLNYHEIPHLYQGARPRHRFDSTSVTEIKWLLQRGISRDYRSRLIDELFAKYVTRDQAEFAANLYISIPELKIMSEAGMNIGFHSRNHLHFPDLEIADLNHEISQPITFFNNLDIYPDSISYPYGEKSNQVKNSIKEFGINKAFTVIPEYFNTETVDNLEIPRFDANDVNNISKKPY